MSSISNLTKLANIFGIDPNLLQSYIKPMGIGAGVGALGLGGADMLGDHTGETPEQRRKSLLKSLALGGALGGGLGGVAEGINHLTGDNAVERYFRDKAQHDGSLSPDTDKYSRGDAAKAVLTHPKTTGAVAGTGAQLLANKRWAEPDFDKTKPDTKDINFKGYRPDDAEYQRQLKALKDQASQPVSKNPDQPGISDAQSKQFQSEVSNAEKLPDAYEKSNAGISNLMRHGRLGREAVQKIIDRTRSPSGITFDPSKGWNPNLGPVDPANAEFYRMRQHTGMGYMTPGQKVTATAYNSTVSPMMNFIDKHFPGLASFLGKHSEPDFATAQLGQGNPHSIKDVNPTLVNPGNNKMPGEMPWYTKGFGNIDKETGNVSRHMYIPEAKIPKMISEGHIPASFGRSHLLAGPLVGLGTGVGVGMLGKHYLNQDGEQLLQKDPQLAKDFYQSSIQK